MSFRGAIIASVIVHLSIFAWAGLSRGAGRPKPSRRVLVTKLVRLGRERPKDYLPRKEVAPPPPARAATPTPKPQAKPVPKKPVKKAPVKKEASPARSLTSALARIKKSAEEVEGREDGSEYGEAARLTSAIAINKYVSAVTACMKANYVIEGMSRARTNKKAVDIGFRVQADGALVDISMEQSSGNSAMDRAAMRAIRRCKKQKPPDASVRARLADEGLVFEFTP